MDQVKFKDLVKLFDELKDKYSIEQILEMKVRIKNNVAYIEDERVL